MDICDKPLYTFTNIILTLMTLGAFFMCFYFATSDDECHFNGTMNRWLVFYGIYDFFFGINLMRLNQIYTFKINLPKSFFNIHTLFIIIPNIIILIIMASIGDLNLHRNDCNYTKYYFYSSHWIFYSGVNFIVCYIGLKYNCIKMIVGRIINEVDIDPAPHIITIRETNRETARERICNTIRDDQHFDIKTVAVDTNKVYECNICFENKKMYALKCKHTFCYDCIMKWNDNMHNDCMVCRQTII